MFDRNPMERGLLSCAPSGGSVAPLDARLGDLMAGSKFPSRRSLNRRPGERDPRADADAAQRTETLGRRPVVQGAAALFAAMEAELQREKAERAADADRMGEMLMRVASVESDRRKLELSLAESYERNRALEQERARLVSDTTRLTAALADLTDRGARGEGDISRLALEIEQLESAAQDANIRILELETQVMHGADALADAQAKNESFRTALATVQAEFSSVVQDRDDIARQAAASAQAESIARREQAELNASARQNDAVAVVMAQQSLEAATASIARLEVARDEAIARAERAEEEAKAASPRLVELADELTELRASLTYAEGQTRAAFTKADERASAAIATASAERDAAVRAGQQRADAHSRLVESLKVQLAGLRDDEAAQTARRVATLTAALKEVEGSIVSEASNDPSSPASHPPSPRSSPPSRAPSLPPVFLEDIAPIEPLTLAPIKGSTETELPDIPTFAESLPPEASIDPNSARRTSRSPRSLRAKPSEANASDARGSRRPTTQPDEFNIDDTSAK